MVMHVEVHHETSFQAMEHDENVNVVLVEPEGRDGSSFMSLGRDTSNTCRDVSLDNTRQTVNTQTSILDLTKDEDDEEDDWEDGSVLFEDLHDANPRFHEEDANSHEEETTNQVSKTSVLGRVFFHQVSDTIDSLCATTSSTCALTPATCEHPDCVPHAHSFEEGQTTELVICVQEQRLQIGLDIWNLLSCTGQPGGAEFASIWGLHPEELLKRSPGNSRAPPQRASLKDRFSRIQSLRVERWSGATRHGLTLANHRSGKAAQDSVHQMIRRVQSMGTEHQVKPQGSRWTGSSWARQFQRPESPSIPTTGPIHETDGYDSDPEYGRVSTTPLHSNHFSEPAAPHVIDDEPEPEEEDDIAEQDMFLCRAVQKTLNSTWTLTWHPNPDNVKEFDIPAKPLCVNIWIERGTVISHSGAVIEPMFMWRDAYQPTLGQRKLNASSQKPWSTRLLNMCRIAECVRPLDKTTYPLAKHANCLRVKTCNDQEFLLETSSPEQVDLICEHWKLAVSRFASLAVAEDIDTIAREFFHPTFDQQTLTVRR